MTDHLAPLLHGEPETPDVTTPPAERVLGARRRLGRGRAWTHPGGAGALALVVTGALLLSHQSSSEAAAASLAVSGGPPQKSYAVGRTVHLGHGSTSVKMPEYAQSLYYTSAGLLVRTNKDGSSDGGAPFHFELVARHGKTTKLGVTLGEVVPSTDPKQPYLAWATMKAGRIRVVVHNVRTDRDVRTVAVPGTFDWGGWEAPPVALVGDHVYVGTNRKTEVVNWRTGKARASRTVPGSQFPDVHGKHAVVNRAHATQVINVASGKVLLNVSERRRYVSVELSPDGRFATTSGGMGAGVTRPFKIHDLRRGTSVRLRGADWGYGWTADGDKVYRVGRTTMTTCDAATGRCHATAVPAIPRHPSVRYPGILYEA
jgi:hypothetical protein